MPLEIAFYSDALATGHYGLGRYARELFRALGNVAPEIQARPVSALKPDRSETRSHQHATRNTQRAPLSLALPYPRKILAGLWSSIALPRLERWTPWADVVHCVELDYRVATRKPLVVTIHDIGPLTHPEFFRKSHPWLLIIALKCAVERAAAIICVSQATADAVEHYMKCRLGDRLTVIPEGVSEEFFQSPAQPSSTPTLHHSLPESAPYFLWAGSLNPRKNLLRVIEAFEQVAAAIPHHLVLCGGLGWESDETLRRIHSSVVGARIHLPGRVSDEELHRFYRRASGFVYVSLMEGFGLPILEAMASGCPVITSNLSSMPEVAGGAALLVNPFEVEEISASMRQLATDRQLVQKLSGLGRSRAEQFRWADCATSTAAIYQRVGQGARAKAVVRSNLQPLAMKTGLKGSS